MTAPVLTANCFPPTKHAYPPPDGYHAVAAPASAPELPIHGFGTAPRVAPVTCEQFLGGATVTGAAFRHGDRARRLGRRLESRTRRDRGGVRGRLFQHSTPHRHGLPVRTRCPD